MPRRYYDYLPEFHGLQIISTIGSWILATGLFIIVWEFIRAKRHGDIAGPNPWNGITLEWRIPSPPPLENFDDTPEVTWETYDFANNLPENCSEGAADR